MSDSIQVTPKVLTSLPTPRAASLSAAAKPVAELSTLELAQALAERLAIAPEDWHRLKSNRKARAGEQAATAIVYLLKDQPEEAQARLQQSVGWLDRSISAPPCPTHGH
ncbi:MAG TPA: DUF6439 family protein [Coleofasciculaceae cyanobacterium]